MVKNTMQSKSLESFL